MKTPSFWNSPQLLSTLLLPAATLYALGNSVKRALAKPKHFSVPIICVGGLTAGGAGKTPVALALGEALKQKNIHAFFLSRGYGGKNKGPLRVNPTFHTAQEVGDEPLLLAQILPTIVAKDRAEGAAYAIEHGAKAIIMDDGFQNTSLVKKFSILVLDGTTGFGNNRLLPAGPLRESPKAGFERADALIVLNPGAAIPFLPGALMARIVLKNTESLQGKKLVAFCGLAYPQKFFSSLKSLGLEVIEEISFSDHYAYTSRDIGNLKDKAAARKALLVTTAKDAARLSPELRAPVIVVDIAVEFAAPEAFHALVDQIIMAS